MNKFLQRFRGISLVVLAAIFGIATRIGVAGAQQTSDLVPCSGPACKWCDVFALLQKVLNTGTSILVFIVIIFIMYGGLLYIIGGSAGSDAQTKRAKEIIMDAIVGFVLILLAWLLVNTVIVGLSGANLQDFLSISCQQFDEIIKPGGGT